MKEGAHIPSAPGCEQWEAQLTDALDGLLGPEQEARFAAHKLICPGCAEMYEEARRGREWLEFLSPEPEPPAGLLERVLATTGMGADRGRAAHGLPATGSQEVASFMPPVWRQPGLLGWMRSDAQPRMAMTAAMAFFSIALTLNLTGVHLSNLRMADLRPHAVRAYVERQLNIASVPIVRYYDHLRFVREVAAQVRELRNQNEEQDGSHQQTQPAAPGESRNRRDRGAERTRNQAITRPRRPATTGTEDGAGAFVESLLGTRIEFMPSIGYMVPTPERSTPWIA